MARFVLLSGANIGNGDSNVARSAHYSAFVTDGGPSLVCRQDGNGSLLIGRYAGGKALKRSVTRAKRSAPKVVKTPKGRKRK